MSPVLIIALLTLLQFFTGLGILALIKISVKAGLLLPLSILLGLAVFSFLPFLLQLLYIPLTAFHIFLSLGVVCLMLNFKYKQSLCLLKLFAGTRFRIRLYDIPFLIAACFIVLVSVWRCFYFPPTPRDLTSGAEVIAEYTVKEKTMINSVFTVNLETTNNQFKPPFITSLQVIYKYAGFPFGQIWLSTIFICFLLFIYHELRLRVHSVIAGALLIIFLAIPEMYAYTFMALFDYPNAVFFFLSSYFLFDFFATGSRKPLILAGLLMAIATYIRSETLILAGFLTLATMWHHIKKWDSLIKQIRSVAIFFLPSVFLYLLSVTIYINLYLPVTYHVEGLVNNDLLNPAPLFERFFAMNGRLIFSEYGVDLYGYFIFIFLLVMILDHVWGDGFNKESSNWIYAVVVIYLGYPLLGYLLPLLDIDHSTKRGLFKIFPLMLFYMGTSSVLIKLSKSIERWENGTATTP